MADPSDLRFRGSEWTREPTGIDTWVRELCAFAPDDVWARADGATYARTSILHWGGARWEPREAGLAGEVTSLGGTADAVYATGRFGLARWNGQAWSIELAQAELGEDGNYYGMRGVCATDRHFVVGFGSHALVRRR